jgi:hypothetical protein
LPKSELQENTEVRTSGSAPIQAFAKLPQSFSHLLKELPVVNDSDVSLLCDFLLKVIRMSQIGQITSPTIYEILYPHCRGEILGLLSQALTASESFDAFHARLL